jgi:hypothetical protein
MTRQDVSSPLMQDCPRKDNPPGRQYRSDPHRHSTASGAPRCLAASNLQEITTLQQQVQSLFAKLTEPRPFKSHQQRSSAYMAEEPIADSDNDYHTAAEAVNTVLMDGSSSGSDADPDNPSRIEW